MANGFTMEDALRMKALREELARLEAMEGAMGPEESAAVYEDSDMDEAMRYAEQDRDLRRQAEQGDAMANTLLRGEDPPSPQEMPPEMRTIRKYRGAAPMQTFGDEYLKPYMRMDGMGAGPIKRRDPEEDEEFVGPME